MNQTNLTLYTFIVAVIGVIVAILVAMFPKLFPTIGLLLLGVTITTWIIILLLLLIIGQQIFIFIRLKRAAL